MLFVVSNFSEYVTFHLQLDIQGGNKNADGVRQRKPALPGKEERELNLLGNLFILWFAMRK